MTESTVKFSPPPEPKIPPSGVDLWFLDLTTCSESSPQIYLDSLSADDLVRAQKLSKNKTDFLLTRLFLRKVLAHYTGMASQDLEIARTTNGKPFLANVSTPLYFNLSHTSNFIVLALSNQAELGVDIEQVSDRDFLKIAQRFFYQDEVQQLASCNPTARAKLFFRLWTLKEAFFKATGGGISTGLDKVSFTFGDESITTSFDSSLNESTEHWQFQQYFMPENLVVALAVHSNKPLSGKWFYGNDLLLLPPEKTIVVR